MRRSVTVAALAAVASCVHADTMFQSWMVAPEVVQAGDTFTVEVWVSMQTTDFDPEGTFFGWATLSIEFEGDRELIMRSTEAYGHVGPFYDGDVTEAGILDILSWQPGPPDGSIIDYSNPFSMFWFDITTAAERGVLDFEYGPHSVYGATHFGWYLDLDTWNEGSVNTLETPNTYYQAEGVTVRVIPAPSGLALLTLAALRDRRRRTRS